MENTIKMKQCDAIFARKKKRKGNLLQKFRELSGEREKKKYALKNET